MISVNDKDNKYGLNIKNRWATEEEIKSATEMIRVGRNNGNNRSGLPVISNTKEIWADTGDSHSLIFGSSGSKKTRLICMPLIKTLADAGESMIISDPKAELYYKTSGYLKKSDYEIFTINLRDIAEGYGDAWNPLTEIYNIYLNNKGQGAEMIADFMNILLEENSSTDGNGIDQFWNQMAVSLGISNMLLLFETAQPNEVNMKSFTRLCADYGESDSLEKNYLYKITQMLNPDSLAYIRYAGLFNIAERTRQSVQASLYALISLFLTNSKLTSMLSQKNEIDIVGARHRKTVIYIIMPDEKSTYNGLVSMFIQEAYVKLIDEAQEMQKKEMVPVRMNFILDEFANLSRINDFNSKISASRSRNIRFYLFCQALNQLKMKYDDETYTIMGNCNNIVYLSTKELELLQYIESLCGQVSYYDEYEYTRPLITTTELQHLSKEEGEALMLIGRNHPFITNLPDIDEYTFETSYPIQMRKRIVNDKIPTLSAKKILMRYTELELGKMF